MRTSVAGPGDTIIGTLMIARAELEHKPTTENLHAYNLATAKAVEEINALASRRAGEGQGRLHQRDTSGDLPFVVQKDGTDWCVTRLDFVNLQESHAGFGKTIGEAMCHLKIAEDEARTREAALAAKGDGNGK